MREFTHFREYMLTDLGEIRAESGKKVNVYAYMADRNARLGPRAQSAYVYTYRTDRATLFRWWTALRKMTPEQRLRAVPPKRSRPYAMPVELETAAKCRVQELVDTGSVVTRSQVRNELLFTALTLLPGETDADVIRRFINVGGKRYIRDFLKFCHFISITNGRPIEVERAQKYQPEFVAEHFRLLLHCHAVCQVQRAVAVADDPDLGWHLPSGGTVQRISNGTADVGDDVLTVKDSKFWVIPLDCPLLWVPPHLIWSYDEKPVVLHNPVRHTLGDRDTIGNIAYGRSPNCTIDFYTNAAPLAHVHIHCSRKKTWRFRTCVR